jgi:uncharacterized hydrophobic protein (TIGR00271 family)
VARNQDQWLKRNISVAEMEEAAYFGHGEDPHVGYSRYWILLILSSVIGAAGMVIDSSATVIGAMIIAPLMTPILGVVLASVLGDERNLRRSIFMLASGALVVVVIAALIGHFEPMPVVAATNGEVASRVSPDLFNLVAALGVGAVASLSLVRRDVAGTLPGVAVAISLVPPLSAAGLALESGASGEAFGALLLFVTNVTAILGTGIMVMALYGVRRRHRVEERMEDLSPITRRRAVMATLIMAGVVLVPLSYTSVHVARMQVTDQRLEAASSAWAATQGWELVDVLREGSEVVVYVEGPNPVPYSESLRKYLVTHGVSTKNVRVHMTVAVVDDLG